MYILWIYKVLEFHIFENLKVFLNVSNMLLSCHIFKYWLNFIIWLLWNSFVKMSCFNDKNFHFQKSLIKPKFKIGSNEFFIWVSWHSCVLKRNNVPWLSWCQMANHYTPKTSHIFKRGYNVILATLNPFTPFFG